MLRQRSIKAFEPTITDPTGAPSPLLKQNWIESELFRHLRHPLAEIGGGIEDPCAIEMNSNTGIVGTVTNLVHKLGRIDRPTGHVVRVLKRDERGLGAGIYFRPDRPGDLLPCHDPVFGGNHPRQGPGDGRHRGHLVVINMAFSLADHFLAGSRVGDDAGEIAHASRGNKERCLTAKNLRGPLLQTVDGRVLHENVIPHLGLGHGPPHLRRRLRYRIASEVDDSVRHNSPSAIC